MNFLLRIILVFASFCIGFFASQSVVVANELPNTEAIQEYILDAYKLQGDNLITNFSQNLDKLENIDKAQAYASIQSTYILRKQSILENTDLSEMTRNILSQYIDYIVYKLEQERQRYL